MAPPTTSRARARPTSTPPGRPSASPAAWALAIARTPSSPPEHSTPSNTMKIKSVRARVFQWKGKTVPPQGNFCSNAMDLLYSPAETMKTFRFHSWTVVEMETDDGLVGYGNVALAPAISKAIIDEYLA